AVASAPPADTNPPASEVNTPADAEGPEVAENKAAQPQAPVDDKPAASPPVNTAGAASNTATTNPASPSADQPARMDQTAPATSSSPAGTQFSIAGQVKAAAQAGHAATDKAEADSANRAERFTHAEIWARAAYEMMAEASAQNVRASHLVTSD
ncbi:hypothetical protein OY671_010602, partial [Metschnikowia pulcherrima]